MWRDNTDTRIVGGSCLLLAGQNQTERESGESPAVYAACGAMALLLLNTDWLTGILNADWLTKLKLCKQNPHVSGDIISRKGNPQG